MPKLNSQKQWQKDHTDKVKEYNTRYLADKVNVTVSLPRTAAERIDAIKDPNESRTEWVRRVLMEKLKGTKA